MASKGWKMNRERKIKELLAIPHPTKKERERLIKLQKLQQYYDLLDGTIKCEDPEVNDAIELLRRVQAEQKELKKQKKREEEEKKQAILKNNMNTLIREHRNRIKAGI